MNLVIIETEKSSKGMIKFNNEYLIERLIRIGRINKMTKLFYISNSPSPELEKYILSNNFGITTKLISLQEENYINILISLASIYDKEPFFFVNINSVFLEQEFSDFITYCLLQEDVDGVIAVTRQINYEKPLSVAMNEEEIIFKLNESKEGYSWFNGGIYYFTSRVIKENDFIYKSEVQGIEKFLQLLITSGYIIKGFSFSKITNVENAIDIYKAEKMIFEKKVFEI